MGQYAIHKVVVPNVGRPNTFLNKPCLVTLLLLANYDACYTHTWNTFVLYQATSNKRRTQRKVNYNKTRRLHLEIRRAQIGDRTICSEACPVPRDPDSSHHWCWSCGNSSASNSSIAMGFLLRWRITPARIMNLPVWFFCSAGMQGGPCLCDCGCIAGYFILVLAGT